MRKIYIQQWDNEHTDTVFGTTLHQTEEEADEFYDRIVTNPPAKYGIAPSGERIIKEVSEEFFQEVGLYANLFIPGRTPDQISYSDEGQLWVWTAPFTLA